MHRPRSWTLGSRAPRYPMLKAYLMGRPTERRLTAPRGTNLGLLAGVATVCALSLAGASALEMLAAAALVTPAALFAVRPRKALPPTPEQALARAADAVVRRIGNPYDLNPAHRFGRLHRAFHPAVVEILEECAVYHARVAAALDEGDWSHRGDLRTSALAAAAVAMDEAIVLAGKTLPYAPEVRPLDAISDALEDVGFGPLTRRVADPMPPGFRPARELAERLRELAVRSETAAQSRRETSPEPKSAAFRHLDAALGEMRRLEEAERELRQGA